MVGIRVSSVSMVGISKSMSVVSVGITVSQIMSITVVSISSSLWLGSSSWLGISRPLAITVSMSVISYTMTMSVISMTISMSIISMETMAISIVAIVGTGISTCFSLTGSSGEQTEGNNSLERNKVRKCHSHQYEEYFTF